MSYVYVQVAALSRRIIDLQRALGNAAAADVVWMLVGHTATLEFAMQHSADHCTRVIHPSL